MEMNRNHYFGIGLLVLLLGLQFKFVDSFQLTEDTTKFLAKRFKKESIATTESPLVSLFGQANPSAMKKTVKPPKWIGWSLISIGGVLVVQSLGMRKPD